MDLPTNWRAGDEAVPPVDGHRFPYRANSSSNGDVKHPTSSDSEERAMTADIVNLRKVRKAKARAEAGVKAAENRVRFGRTKAERRLEEARSALDERQIEALRRDDRGRED